MLVHNSEPQIKKSRNIRFNVPQAALDDAEILKLMGIFILHKINKLVHINDHGLYRDDGLMVVSAKRRTNNNIRKKLFPLFNHLGFKITVYLNVKSVQYLDVELNLTTGTVSPYIKPNTYPKVREY